MTFPANAQMPSKRSLMSEYCQRTGSRRHGTRSANSPSRTAARLGQGAPRAPRAMRLPAASGTPLMPSSHCTPIPITRSRARRKRQSVKEKIRIPISANVVCALDWKLRATERRPCSRKRPDYSIVDVLRHPARSRAHAAWGLVLIYTIKLHREPVRPRAVLASRRRPRVREARPGISAARCQ